MDRRTLLAAGATLGAGGVGYTYISSDESSNGDPSGENGSAENGTTVEEGSFVESHPVVTDYSLDSVEVRIPENSLPDGYLTDGEFRIELRAEGEWLSESSTTEPVEDLTEGSVREFDLDVDPAELDVIEELRYTVVIKDEDEEYPRMGYEVFVAETDRFDIENGEIVPNPIEYDVEPRNADDSDASYRRDVAEGFYALQFNGNTADQSWKIDIRVRKAMCQLVLIGDTYVRETLSGRVAHSFGHVEESTTMDRHSVSMRQEVTREFGAYEFSDSESARAAADIVRSTPDSPEPLSGVEGNPKDIRITLLEGGDDTDDVSTALAGLCWYLTGSEVGIVEISGDYPVELEDTEYELDDHRIAGLSGESYSGVSFGDSPRLYLLEATEFDSYVGETHSDVEQLYGAQPTVSYRVDLEHDE